MTSISTIFTNESFSDSEFNTNEKGEITTFTKIGMESYLKLSELSLSNHFFHEKPHLVNLNHAVLGYTSELSELNMAWLSMRKILDEIQSVQETLVLSGKEPTGEEKKALDDLFTRAHKIETNIIEEYGDLSWYNATATRACMSALGARFKVVDKVDCADIELKLNLSSMDEVIEVSLEEHILNQVGTIADQCKRAFHYGEEVQLDWEKIAEATNNIWAIIAFALRDFGVTLDKIQAVNINKLLSPGGRYRGKFESHYAVNRDIQSEEKILSDSLN